MTEIVVRGRAEGTRGRAGLFCCLQTVAIELAECSESFMQSSLQADMSRLFQRSTSSSSVEFGVQAACIKRTHLTLCCRPDGTAGHFILVGLWGSFSPLTWTSHIPKLRTSSFELSERRKPCCLLKSSHNSSRTSKTLICT